MGIGIRSAFGSGARLVLQQPLLLGVAAVLAVFGGLLQLAQFVGPIVGLLLTVANYALIPFFAGGCYGLAAEAFDGHARARTFLDEGIANYLSLLVGYILFAAIAFVAFIPIAIVLDDEDPVEAFRRSYRLVRSRFANVFGYTVVRMAASLVGSIPIVYYSISRQMTGFQAIDPGATGGTPGGTSGAPGAMQPGGMRSVGSPVEALPFIAATIVLTSLISAVLYPAHVAYFRELAARYGDGHAGGSGGDGGDGGAGEQDDLLLDADRQDSGRADPSDPHAGSGRRRGE